MIQSLNFLRILMFARMLIILLFWFTASAANSFYLSKNNIPIDVTFAGENVDIYGIRDNGNDVIITLKGQKTEYKIQQKEKKAGIWIGGKKVTISNVYRYYAIFSEEKLEHMRISHLLQEFELGIENISSFSIAKELEYYDFKTALIQNKRQKNLFVEMYGIKIINPQNLIYTTFNLPLNLPEGKYVVSVYQIQNGEISSIHNLPLYIHQTGVLKFIKTTSQNQKFLYFAISVGVSVGFALFGYTIFGGKWKHIFMHKNLKKTKKIRRGRPRKT